MSHLEYRKTLDEIFKHDGLRGVERYFSEHEKLTQLESEAKAAAWGYMLEVFASNKPIAKVSKLFRGEPTPPRTT